MAQQYHNSFEKLGLIAPDVQRDYYDQYCRTNIVGRTNKDIDQSPFRRRVDLWFAGFSFAARKQLNRIDLTKEKTYQFITVGEIFTGEDSWRIEIITLVAIAIEDSLEIVEDPSCVMSIANGLAAAGVPYIVKILNEGPQAPIWNLSDSLEKLLQSDTGTAEKSGYDRIAETLL